MTRASLLQAYWQMLVADGCILDRGPAEIAHCHGGSIVERLQEPKAKGWKLPRMDWLVLPLCPLHHRHPPTRAQRIAAAWTGGPTWEALDDNVAAWEALYGPQAHHIDVLAERHGLPLWTLAQQGAKS